MPSKKSASPSPELREPYDECLYADLRHEVSVRHIRVPRSGPQRLRTRTGFIRLLRDWDASHTGAKKTPKPSRRTSPRRNQNSTKNQTQMTSTRAIRARRGCRFRLINVLLSKEFNRRWSEMVSRGGKMTVNKLWLDVHAAFMAKNPALDSLHFQDALFVNVTPNVILAHPAARLLQMWVEIVAMYRNAVAQAKEAAAHNDNVHSFFDFCAGRLDLLYLHMAMLLDPKLYEFIMSDKLPAAEPFSRSKAKAVTAAAESQQVAAESKPEAKTKAATVKAKAVSAPPESATKVAAVKAKADSASPSTPTPAASTEAAVTTPAKDAKLSGVLTQNPEMKEPPSPADVKTTEKTAALKPAAAKTNKSGAKAKLVKPATLPHKPAAQKKPQKAAGKGKATTTAASAKEVKPKASPSKQKQTVSPSKAKVASKPVNKKSPASDKPVQTKSLGKRPREEEDTAIVEVPTVSDIVSHPGKRVHTTTTTISTALATRPADVMLPPDEWDILESRLRKVNENIDRCHRGLSSVEGNVSETYKQSLESDLRFYSAIKQRLQEQLLVVMQSGY